VKIQNEERLCVIMNDKLDFDDYLVQRGIIELPREIRGIVGRIMEEYRSGGINRKAPSDFGDHTHDAFNLIPSKHKGGCHSLLVGICYDRDNLEERIRECLDLSSIHCRGITEEIFIITTQWNSFTINKLKGHIEALRGNGVIINLIHVTERSYVLMPV
jgi:hypothetical protein